jgi:hypothetical protein
VRREGDRLAMNFYGPQWLDLIPHSATRFSLRHTAGEVEFNFNGQDVPESVTFRYGGEENLARRRE